MTRDYLVKQLEKAERRSAVEKSYDSDISFINAKTTLQLWDIAYAAGAKDAYEMSAKVIENDCHDDMTRAEEAAAIRARGEK
jgi:hypothetical protein